MRNIQSAEEAIGKIKSGQRIFLHGGAATPKHLVSELARQASRLKKVEITGISFHGEMPLAQPEFKDNFHINSCFVSKNIQEAVNSGNGDYIPIFLSQIPRLFYSGLLDIDVALIQVSPPDHFGFCSLGVSVDVARAAVLSAKTVIAQVNTEMPRTHGDGLIHVKDIHALVEKNEALDEVHFGKDLSEVHLSIGKRVAELVEDRATLQMGIGCIPDAVLKMLGQHKDLGVHTEMLSDGIIPLLLNGAISNKYKKKHRGRVVTGFALGSKQLYDFVNDNPEFVFLDSEYVNDTDIIRKNPRVTAINSAIEIDLSGQVCADSIGTLQFSGVGGQMDFIRGAALSEGGKPIIALPSRTTKGESRLVPFLKQGAGVVTTRAHIHYVVTEYGSCNLFGKNLRQRAHALIQLAHPDDRENLEKAAFERFRHL